MSDTGPVADTAPAPDAPAPAPDAAPDPGGTQQWTLESSLGEVAKLRKENASIRTRFKPFEESFGHLTPEAQEALKTLAHSLAVGDEDKVGEWFYNSANNVFGPDAWQQLASKYGAAGATAIQQAAADGQTEGAAAGMTPEQIAKIVRENVEAELANRDNQALQAQADQIRQGWDSEMQRAGIIPDSPQGTQVYAALRFLVESRNGGAATATEAIEMLNRLTPGAIPPPGTGAALAPTGTPGTAVIQQREGETLEDFTRRRMMERTKEHFTATNGQ